jgi:predicted ATPase
MEGLRIRNYRSLRDIAMGRIGTDGALRDAAPLTPLTVLIGKNGVGKNALFDALGFIADCMETDLETVCNARNRGGYDALVSSGVDQPIGIAVHYRESGNGSALTYELSVGKDPATGRAIVLSERLSGSAASGGDSAGSRSFLQLERGKGTVYTGDDAVGGDEALTRTVEFDPHKSALVSLAEQFSEYPRIARFKKYVQSWYFSGFTPEAARRASQGGEQTHLNPTGDNIGNVIQYMERAHPVLFRKILVDVATEVPGIGTVEPHRDPVTDTLHLLFKDRGFARPFTQEQMSDGTLKMFGYFLLLNDPEPAPLVCIREPENGLYLKLLETLANEFKAHATGREGSPQIFITTHHPYLVDVFDPEDVWILEKGRDGFSTISKAADYEDVKDLAAGGFPLGELWYKDFFDPR